MTDEIGQEMNDQCLFEEIEELQSSLERLHDKVNEIKKPLDLELRAARAIEVLDKFDVYMKNIDKLNVMVNELKGHTSLVRAWGNKTSKKEKDIKHIITMIAALCKETDSE
jgi:prefoldin subunit 5